MRIIVVENKCAEAIAETMGLYPVFRKHLIPSVESNKLPVPKTAIRVLVLLSELYPVTMSRLAEETVISPQQLSKIITELETEGYVERINDKEHRRLVWARLTDKGRELVEDHRKTINAVFWEKFSVFTEEELEQLVESCRTFKILISKLSR